LIESFLFATGVGFHTATPVENIRVSSGSKKSRPKHTNVGRSSSFAALDYRNGICALHGIIAKVVRGIAAAGPTAGSATGRGQAEGNAFTLYVHVEIRPIWIDLIFDVFIFVDVVCARVFVSSTTVVFSLAFWKFGFWWLPQIFIMLTLLYRSSCSQQSTRNPTWPNTFKRTRTLQVCVHFLIFREGFCQQVFKLCTRSTSSFFYFEIQSSL
jgi:hypothetical protein